MDSDTDVEFTSPAELRAIFNAYVWPRVVSGEIVEVVLDSDDPSPHANQPPGTKSQTMGYFLRGERVAEAHRYLLKDDSIGASGLPDPKLVIHEGVMLLVG